MRSVHVLTVCAAASIAAAQGTMTYAWDVSDTGNGDGFIEPGETALLTLYALMDPGATGFAGSIFEIAGDDEWQSKGAVVRIDNLLDSLTDNGTLHGDNSITGIEAFQLPPAFNPDFDASNPIALYQVEWEPDFGQLPIFAEVWTQNHLNNDVYVDDFGTSVAYDGINGSTTVVIFPSPGTALVLSCGVATFARRRCS
jgi:hypothetical protein